MRNFYQEADDKISSIIAILPNNGEILLSVSFINGASDGNIKYSSSHRSRLCKEDKNALKLFMKRPDKCFVITYCSLKVASLFRSDIERPRKIKINADGVPERMGYYCEATVGGIGGRSVFLYYETIYDRVNSEGLKIIFNISSPNEKIDTAIVRYWADNNPNWAEKIRNCWMINGTLCARA